MLRTVRSAAARLASGSYGGDRPHTSFRANARRTPARSWSGSPPINSRLERSQPAGGHRRRPVIATLGRGLRRGQKIDWHRPVSPDRAPARSCPTSSPDRRPAIRSYCRRRAWREVAIQARSRDAGLLDDLRDRVPALRRCAAHSQSADCRARGNLQSDVLRQALGGLLVGAVERPPSRSSARRGLGSRFRPEISGRAAVDTGPLKSSARGSVNVGAVLSLRRARPRAD